jgi:hypothetical protein
MERSLRQVPAARAIFKRCVGRKMEADGQLGVALQWLRFEREEGRWEGRSLHAVENAHDFALCTGSGATAQSTWVL